MKPFSVELGRAASRDFRKLPDPVRRRVRESLQQLATDVAKPGRTGGKRTKTIHGTGDTFHRLRVGDYRVMYDVAEEQRIILVLGIVHRSRLERWLRGR